MAIYLWNSQQLEILNALVWLSRELHENIHMVT